ncbi:MAG: lytic transglycosylase domain-containing protein, partial [Mesorhizobium sp.]
AEPVAISHSPQLQKWQEFLSEASRRFRVPQAWIYAVMDAESGGNTMRAGRPITSSAGAIGLMQVMPGTYAEMRVEHGLGRDPHDPRDNILAGTAYLRAMYD